MTEYQTHEAVTRQLYEEVSRLKAINAELKGIIEARIKPNNSLVQAARQALEALEEATSYTSCPSWSPSMTDECNAAIVALREAMEAAPADPNQEAFRLGYAKGVDDAERRAKARGEQPATVEQDAVACPVCEAVHAILDADESQIIRNAKDGYPEGRTPRVLTLQERVTALCVYAADWRRWCVEAESSPLYTAPQPARQPLTDEESRTKFEVWAASYSTLSIERDDDPVLGITGYRSMEQTMLWHAWQAAKTKAPEGASEGESGANARLDLAKANCSHEFAIAATSGISLCIKCGLSEMASRKKRAHGIEGALREALEAAPQLARQPLTDEQIQDIWCSARTEGNQHGPFWFARAIEKAHGIGGETC